MSVYRQYKEIKFQADTMKVIEKANEIIARYEQRNRRMTLRQLYYQMVVENFFANDDRNYDRLSNIISDARLAGLVSWTAIEDMTRYTRDNTMFESPAQAFACVREQYMTDLWAGQPFRLLVGIEKDAMVGVISEICHELRVPFTSFRGYSSQSQQWRLGQQLAKFIQQGQRPILLHLGDHDPDGVDMTRDNKERLSLFAGVQIQVVRLALNMEQVERFKPPPNPAKTSSARFKSYEAKYGPDSWELDALKPEYVEQLLTDAVRKFRDQALWDERLAEEAEDKDSMDLAIAKMKGEN